MATIDAERALALTGVPFRPQGRDERRGLDCVGLCLAAYRLPLSTARRDYRLRGDYRAEVEAVLQHGFRRVSKKQQRPGDLLWLAVAADQSHLAVRTDAGFVHADARLRRVVETPGEPQWQLIGAYRRRVRRHRGAKDGDARPDRCRHLLGRFARRSARQPGRPVDRPAIVRSRHPQGAAAG